MYGGRKMFYSVTGKVILTEAGTVVLEAGGIGYRLTVSGRTLGYAAEHSREEAVRLFTHLSVREDAIELFGFCDQSELSVFRQLISVSGVGPKAAVSILTQLSPQDLARAVVSGDYKALSRAQGVGKRIAERIILELKDKISKEAVLPYGADGATAVSASAPTDPDKLADAESTLTVLGYGKSEIYGVLQSIDTSALSLEDIIKEALKKLMK